MCGICGSFNFDREKPVNRELIRQMTDAMAHRGPDGDGHYLSGPIGLGHRRLSIIDLDGGAQPMSNEDRTVWVTYNGEIYNFAELRKELDSYGHVFRSGCDTEVIVHAYEQWGEECVKRLRGMFAFGLWDSRNRVLFLARDRVGIKPLYYSRTHGSLLFASELKSLLVSPTVSRRRNFRAMDRFLTYRYLPGNETLFADIHKLDPGHYLKVTRHGVQMKQYWDLRFDRPRLWRSVTEAVEALRELLGKTVSEHMISDVPVGVLLSGGVDSTAILRYAVEEASEPIRTFTVGFSGGEVADERPYARMAARHYGTEHHEISLTGKEFGDFLPKYVWHMEEPVCEPPAVALFHVARLAREWGVKVLLSGEGGDEGFGGYETYRNIVLLEQLKRVLGRAKGVLRLGLEGLASLGWHGAATYGGLVYKRFPEYYNSRAAIEATVFSRHRDVLYTKEFAREIGDDPVTSIAGQLAGGMNGRTVLDHMLYVDTKTWLPDDLLVKADKMTMATSTELRVPLLDSRVLEFAASLPSSYKVRHFSTKRVLKRALRGVVPTEILRRKKAGFPVPYASWFKGELKEFVQDTLLGDSAVKEILNKRRFRTLVLEATSCPNSAKEVFSILVLELWHRQFVCPGISAR